MLLTRSYMDSKHHVSALPGDQLVTNPTDATGGVELSLRQLEEKLSVQPIRGNVASVLSPSIRQDLAQVGELLYQNFHKHYSDRPEFPLLRFDVEFKVMQSFDREHLIVKQWRPFIQRSL